MALQFGVDMAVKKQVFSSILPVVAMLTIVIWCVFKFIKDTVNDILSDSAHVHPATRGMSDIGVHPATRKMSDIGGTAMKRQTASIESVSAAECLSRHPIIPIVKATTSALAVARTVLNVAPTFPTSQVVRSEVSLAVDPLDFFGDGFDDVVDIAVSGHSAVVTSQPLFPHPTGFAAASVPLSRLVRFAAPAAFSSNANQSTIARLSSGLAAGISPSLFFRTVILCMTRCPSNLNQGPSGNTLSTVDFVEAMSCNQRTTENILSPCVPQDDTPKDCTAIPNMTAIGGQRRRKRTFEESVEDVI